MRVIYPIEEDRIRKGKAVGWRHRWWMVPLDWMTLLGVAFSFSVFGYAPIAIADRLGPAYPQTRMVLFTLQALISCGAIWLFWRGRMVSRAYAAQGVIVASIRAGGIGLALGQMATLLFAYVMWTR